MNARVLVIASLSAASCADSTVCRDAIERTSQCTGEHPGVDVRACDEERAAELTTMTCEAVVAAAASDSVTRELLCDLGFVRYCGGGFDAGACTLNGFLTVEHNSMIVLGADVMASSLERTYVTRAEGNRFVMTELPCARYTVSACWAEGCGTATADFLEPPSTALTVWLLLPNVGHP